METAGYFASILIGISLGLIGGGGSILTVPVLVYLFAVDTVLATTYSLFIVGSTSLVGSFSYFKKNLIDVKTALFFGGPSILTVFATRAYLLPGIPDKILTIGNFTVGKNMLLLVFFALLMMLASYSMIKKETKEKMINVRSASHLWIIVQGLAVGLVTGLIGAGGGFLIIPTLVNFMKLPMKTAIGTSLLIIAVNALIGFAFSIHQSDIQWPFLATLSGIAIAGIFIGTFLSAKIDSKKLKPIFGWFVLIMGVYIIVKETFLK